ncbi:MAG: VOC family protein [Chitinophagales bacterium]
MIAGWHHIAIICSDIEKSVRFYIEVFNFREQHRVFRSERNSWKVDLVHANKMTIELFTFPDAPTRNSYPEALGLRHIAFAVQNLDTMLKRLELLHIPFEAIRIDPETKKRFTFLADPDNLPIELYEI